MNKQLKTFLLSLLTPGLGYLENGDKKSFYKTLLLFLGVIVLSVLSRSVTGFPGLILLAVTLPAIYLFAAVQASLKVKTAGEVIKNAGLLKLLFTLSFVLITELSFGNRRSMMGFDVMNMAVPVMQPALLQGDKFLIDTWAYNKVLPKRGDIIAHSFNGQQGVYLNRIIAVGHDKIEIKNSKVYLNGHILNEHYVLPENVTKPESRDMNALVVPEGHYFVMGDNRDASFGDSRFSGTILIDNIVGKTTDIISSQNKSRIGRTIK